MHRLFAALPVPEELAERLRPLRTELPGARWRRDDQFHITLHFYGEVRTEIAEEIAFELEAVTGRGMALSLQGVGWFGRRAPHSLHARLAASGELTALARACRRIAHRLKLSSGPEPFIPHITLAYCNNSPLDLVRRWSEDFQMLRSEPVWIDRFNLYESFPGRNDRPSRYVAQAGYSLA